MIARLKFKTGKNPAAAGLVVNTSAVTIFVGPNNSGKSRVLSDIENFCLRGDTNQSWTVLSGLDFEPINENKLDDVINQNKGKMDNNEFIPPGHVKIRSRRQRIVVDEAQLRAFLRTPSMNLNALCQWFIAHLTLKLDGQSRINLVNEQQANDLQNQQNGTMGVLFTDDRKRLEVRRIIKEAFNAFLVIDPTKLGFFRLRLSDRAPAYPAEERGVDEAAVSFHARATQIEQASDGVKAFTGIVTEIIAGDPLILLLDEPEAFLHPSLSFKLGFEISRIASNADKRIFVSTHSASFLMGCLQSGVDVNIIRLTYRDKIATTRILENADLTRMIRNPLLRSTNVLAGLFYEFVIVTESDTDRALYQEINERLLRFNPEMGIPNCLFLNAQNKQTIPTIIGPLRQIGVPTAGIFDIDVLKDGGNTWSTLLSTAGIPEVEHQSLSNLRAALKEMMFKTGKDMKRDGGLRILKDPDREAAENLLNRLSDYGLFVVPGGELESWLPTLKISGHGPAWLVKIFELMGEDPDSASYVKPTHTDVWVFISRIRAWMINMARRGIPA